MLEVSFLKSNIKLYDQGKIKILRHDILQADKITIVNIYNVWVLRLLRTIYFL